ncbi:MAG: hypothetical protein QW212_00680 [Nitrososphaerales archaeon]
MYIDDLRSAYEEALKLVQAREESYGVSTWEDLGLVGCIEAARRKVTYLLAQSTRPVTAKFEEDALDLLNWAAFIYILAKRRRKRESPNSGL